MEGKYFDMERGYLDKQSSEWINFLNEWGDGNYRVHNDEEHDKSKGKRNITDRHINDIYLHTSENLNREEVCTKGASSVPSQGQNINCFHFFDPIPIF